ncbi:glycosyltransferase family 4 protein [Acidiluteibacter ferrifornacis]|uniref:Glycosyltransferase n=1 Tax=Acidiluteibacter ferrifornacis TaxID=2692424 RepID=A0A6N9NNH3_9FLAO|nr:glycosyltransferase family 4 protein [Acidiluteibacter ferrifornacis]NBG67444.1 glycosyltransferase [Acidiluteibacter ferrifornacis]
MAHKRVLYISYDGLTDPLGQSQIIPYLSGLSNKGYRITILSNEKPQNYHENKAVVEEKLEAANIQWKFTFYSNKPPVVSTAFGVRRMRKMAFHLAKKQSFDIIHCRSILATMVGDSVRKKLGGKLIFDIRGFWADERVEGGLWKLDNKLYNAIYTYFKKKEKEFFKTADAVITLTENAKNHVLEHFKTKENFQVVPCAVDLDHFNPDHLNQTLISDLKTKWGVQPDDFVLSYVGSLGTRYRLKEMLQFFKHLLTLEPKSKFLFITKSDTSQIYKYCDELKINTNKIIIDSCSYGEIPNYIAVSQASIFFIVTSFSGKAVSPTKQGEIMSLGLPIVCNANLGDSDTILKETNTGIVPPDYSDQSLKNSAEELLSFTTNAATIRAAANEYFALDKAVEKYHSVYKNL